MYFGFKFLFVENYIIIILWKILVFIYIGYEFIIIIYDLNENINL